ncbi:hypothetical protein IG631_21371 [Alternaria alternata]|nr:hypothetical protein IG631_21371 [Alternaria alternata]
MHNDWRNSLAIVKMAVTDQAGHDLCRSLLNQLLHVAILPPVLLRASQNEPETVLRVEVCPALLVAIILWCITAARRHWKPKHGLVVAFWYGRGRGM